MQAPVLMSHSSIPGHEAQSASATHLSGHGGASPKNGRGESFDFSLEKTHMLSLFPPETRDAETTHSMNIEIFMVAWEM